MLRARLFMAATMSLLTISAVAEGSETSPTRVDLPQSVAGWSLSEPVKRIEPKAIFDYMDGAGELYLAYRFKFLDVYEYVNSGESSILVELYWMESPDDAYGLLSGDWDGDPVNLSALKDSAVPQLPSALYGAGLLRVWSGDLYARVLTGEETASSRRAILELGKAIVAGRPESMPPRLIRSLSQAVGSEFALRAGRTVYLRSHLVLNSAYFLSSENLLDLGLKCELAAAVYASKPGASPPHPVHLLLVRYPDEVTARQALTHFQSVYLAEKLPAGKQRGAVAIEDGWTGFILSGRSLGLVFEAPDESATNLFLENAKQSIDKAEELHEQ